MMLRFARRFAVVASAVAFGVVAAAGAAAAHVTINPGEAPAGGYTVLNLRVPNESDTASTVKVELTLPEDAPFASARTSPVPGWDIDTATRTLDTPVDVHGRQITEAVSTITWTAESDDAGVQPGQFVEFPISVGPLPETVGAVLVFKAIQTYSDDTEAAWIENPAPAGAEEPEYPAPTLTVDDAEGDHHSGGDGDEDADDAAEDEHDSDSGEAALWVAIGAGVVALAGLGVGVVALRRR